MLTLATTDTIAASSATGQIALTIMGMELDGTTELYRILYQGQLGVDPATVYTCTAPQDATFVKSMHAVNLSGGSEAFRIFVDGLAPANSITPEIELGENGWAVYDENGWQVYGSGVTLASIETEEGPTLVVVDIKQRRLLEGMSLRLDEMANYLQQQSMAFQRQ
jgi:hypothetical protein